MPRNPRQGLTTLASPASVGQLAAAILLVAIPFLTAPLDPIRIGVGLALFPALIWISWSDLDSRIVPDLATAWVALLGGAVCLTQDSRPNLTLAVALAVTLALGLIGEALWRARQVDPLGLGDVKLISAGTLLVGANHLWLMIL